MKNKTILEKLELAVMPVFVLLLICLAVWSHGRSIYADQEWTYTDGWQSPSATPTLTLVPADGWWTSLPTPAPLPTRPGAAPSATPSPQP